jgi:hypothetical protein
LVGLLAVAAVLYFWEPTQEQASGPVQAIVLAQEAAPDQTMVTVQTEPAGGTVLLDGVIYGSAPVTVPVPTDPHTHKLCVQYGMEKTCRDLTGLAFSKDDPYLFKVSAP